MLKLSIITVNLNNRNGLKRTLDSIFSQDYRDYESIVIDGGSADGSVDIIKVYADKITYWVSEADSGIYNAMNKGILQAKGEYCLFLNSGDWIIERKTLRRIFSNDFNEGLVAFKINKKNNGLIQKNKRPKLYDFYMASLPHHSTLIKKELFYLIGLYNESFKIVSDWEFFMLAIIKYGISYRYIDFVICDNELSGISKTLWDVHAQEREWCFINHFGEAIYDYEEMSKWKSSRFLTILYLIRGFLIYIKRLFQK
ncbi:MAG: glycosyltransferase [Chlorobium sp.]|nr:MAG: glycosyltransferase [Chlorobium sp.]